MLIIYQSEKILKNLKALIKTYNTDIESLFNEHSINDKTSPNKNLLYLPDFYYFLKLIDEHISEKEAEYLF